MSDQSKREIEAKFQIASAARAASLQAAPGLGRGFRFTPPTTVTQVDFYLDTPEYRLVRNGYALRLRHTEKGLQAGLKNIGLADHSHWHKRLELEVMLSDTGNPLEWTAWPAELRDFLKQELPS